jgi:hypothetical protein
MDPMNPLCQDAKGAHSTTQGFAKAFGLRELEVTKELGARGLAASIWTRNTTDDSKQDFGYRPAIDLMLNQIKQSIP